MMIDMTSIPTPVWASPYARHVKKTRGSHGEAAMSVIQPLLPQIYDELHIRVNEFANDPDQCYQDTEDFPEQHRLDGGYYIASETFEGNAVNDFYRLWVMIHCTEKPWHPNQEKVGYDYLGLEAIVTVARDGASFRFDEGFNTSCI